MCVSQLFLLQIKNRVIVNYDKNLEILRLQRPLIFGLLWCKRLLATEDAINVGTRPMFTNISFGASHTYYVLPSRIATKQDSLVWMYQCFCVVYIIDLTQFN